MFGTFWIIFLKFWSVIWLFYNLKSDYSLDQFKIQAISDHSCYNLCQFWNNFDTLGPVLAPNFSFRRLLWRFWAMFTDFCYFLVHFQRLLSILELRHFPHCLGNFYDSGLYLTFVLDYFWCILIILDLQVSFKSGSVQSPGHFDNSRAFLATFFSDFNHARFWWIIFLDNIHRLYPLFTVVTDITINRKKRARITIFVIFDHFFAFPGHFKIV